MFKNIVKVLFLLVFTFLYSSVWALELSWDVYLDEAKSNSLTLSWDEVDDALCYSIYYDTDSVAESDYANEALCIWNNYTLEWLDSDTKYFLSMTVASQDFVEWWLSKEFSFKTLWSVWESLKLESVEAEYKKQLKLSFNLDLDESKPLEFKIVDKDDDLIELELESVELTWPREVVINLVEDLEAGLEYDLTVLSATWAEWENIEFGVNGIASFIVPDDLKYEDEIEEVENNQETTEEVIEEPTIENTDLELNSASPSWEDIATEDLNKNTQMASETAEDLPSTWPEHILIILLAFLISFFVIKSRAKSY